jgi:hypothetical protein
MGVALFMYMVVPMFVIVMYGADCT